MTTPSNEPVSPEPTTTKTDNNDDNEFATGFKKYSAESKQDSEVKPHPIESSFLSFEQKVVNSLSSLSEALEKGGITIQEVGTSLRTVGSHLRYYFERPINSEKRKDDKSSSSTQSISISEKDKLH